MTGVCERCRKVVQGQEDPCEPDLVRFHCDRCTYTWHFHPHRPLRLQPHQHAHPGTPGARYPRAEP